MRSGALVRAAAAALLAARAAAAQAPLPDRWLNPARPDTARASLPGAELRTLVTPSRDFPVFGVDAQDSSGPWWAPIASAIVPGSGQALQRKRRAIAYVAADGFLLAQYADALGNGRALRREYRVLARIARTFYTSRFPTGDFEYYERMEQFVESGAFDLNPGGDLEPETDTLTFNGQTWRLARETFWDDPSVPPPRDSDSYRRALDFYARRAVAPDFRWSWRNAQLEQDLFRRTIQRSNSAFRLSSEYLGTIIANHALSAVDAFIIVRLSRGVTPQDRYRVSAQIPWAPFGRGPRPESRP